MWARRRDIFTRHGSSPALYTCTRCCVQFVPPGAPGAKPLARGMKDHFGEKAAFVNQKMLAPNTYSDLRDKPFKALEGFATVAGTKYTVDRSSVFEEWRHECYEPVHWHLSKLGTALCKVADRPHESHDAVQLQIIKGCNVFEIDCSTINSEFEETAKALHETLQAFELNRAGFVIMARCGFLYDDVRKERVEEATFSNTAPVRNKMFPILQRVLASSFPQHAMNKGFKIKSMTDEQLKAVHLRRTVNPRQALALSPHWIEGALVDLFNHAKIDTVDVLMLQGVEYLYEHYSEEEADELLLQCFVYVESQIKQGNVLFYGISSPNLAPPIIRVDPPLPPDAKIPDQLRNPWRVTRVLNLYKILAIAEKAGGKEHRLRFVEYAVNMTQHQAMSTPLPYDGNHTLQSLCKTLKLTTFGIQPLETTDLQNHVQRYHSFPLDPDLKSLRMNFFHAIERLTLKELEVQKAYEAAQKNLPPKIEVFIGSLYVCILQRQLTSYFKFCEAFDHQLMPTFRRALAKVREAAQGDLKEWCSTYEAMVGDVFKIRRRLLEHKHGMKAAQMNMHVDIASPTLAECPIFSQKALTFAAQGCDVLLSGFHVSRYFHEATELNPLRNKVIPRSEMEAIFTSPDLTFASYNPPDPYMMEQVTMGKFSKQKCRTVENSTVIDLQNPKFADIPEEVDK
jgi:hypothetical protein